MDFRQQPKPSQQEPLLPLRELLADQGISLALRRDVARQMARRTQTLTLEDLHEFAQHGAGRRP